MIHAAHSDHAEMMGMSFGGLLASSMLAQPAKSFAEPTNHAAMVVPASFGVQSGFANGVMSTADNQSSMPLDPAIRPLIRPPPSATTTDDSKLDVTVLIAVRNEAANLPKCLAALEPAESVLVVDSGSTDQTARIAESLGATVVQYQHVAGVRKKRQWAMDELNIQTRWILLLDADEVVPARLWVEIRSAIDSPRPCSGYLIEKGFHFLGKSMRWGGFSHSAVLLIRRGEARFEQMLAVPGDTLDMEVHERIIVAGPIGKLRTPLIHEDFKGLEAYIDRHNRYSTWEAHVRRQALDGVAGGETVRPKLLGNTQERRRWIKRLAIRLPGEPWLWFCYHYLFRLGFLHGRAGLIASQIRRHYIESARAKLHELRLQTAADSTTRFDATNSR